MRILVVTQWFWPHLGGAEVMVRRLAAEWTRTGHPTTVLTCQWDDAPAHEWLDGIEVVRLPVTRWRLVGTLRFLRQVSRWILSRRDAFDLAYVSMLKHAAYATIGAGRRIGLPVVVRAEGAGITGDAAWLAQARCGRAIRKRCLRADVVVAPSRVIAQELSAAGFEVMYLPNGVPLPAVAWDRSATLARRRKLGLPDALTIVFTGRLHRNKGLADGIEALPLIERAIGTRCQLLLVGDGPERQALMHHARTLGMADRVVFAGQVDDVEPYLRAADLFVLPSYDEGLSVALLEALALGMPCVASDIPANRGWLPAEMLPLAPIRRPADLAQSIADRLQQAHDTAAIEAQRRAVGLEFGLEAVAERHLDLFRRLVAKKRSISGSQEFDPTDD